MLKPQSRWMTTVALCVGLTMAWTAPAAAAQPSLSDSTTLLAKKSSKKKKKKKKKQICPGGLPHHFHEVLPGEIAGAIAGRYGVYLQDLIELNPRDLRKPNLIRPGMKLLVCPNPLNPPRHRFEIEYRVKKRDNLGRIAERHGVSLEELKAWNPKRSAVFRDPRKLRIGQTLAIWQEGDVLDAFRPPSDRDDGKLKNGVPFLPLKTRYYRVKNTERKRNWGTQTSVGLLAKVLKRYGHKRTRGIPVVVGDLSKRGGGPISLHRSHQRGVDVDVGYVHVGKQPKGFKKIKSDKQLDTRRTWELVHGFLKTGEIRFIFMDYKIQESLYKYALKKKVSKSKLDQYFQYPRGRKRTHGIIRHWKGHADHMHIRFRR